MRWFQFGLFCPVMRLHGTRKWQSDYKARYPGIICEGGGYNEIWHFGKECCDAIKELIVLYLEKLTHFHLILLRQRFKPYILSCAEKTSKTGEPIMRPMFFDFPGDERCYRLDDQYMFGSDILFAPILNPGQTEREVYLPKGKWVRTTDKTVHDGGRTVTVKADPTEFVAFARAGAEVIDVFE